MTTWSSEELNRIGKAEELMIASQRADGTLRKPLPIWVVRVGDDLYVRSMNGRTSAWFRGVQTRLAGHIRAGGLDKDVIFVEESDSNINDLVDTAYAKKYGHYDPNIIRHMQGAGPRAATIKILPR